MTAAPALTLQGPRRPEMKSGLYELTAIQTVTIGGQRQDRFLRSQFLEVAGAQHALPPGTVQSVYPPDGGNGRFDQVLPHVVLSDATLPWQRSADPAAGDAGPGWLAVLLLSAQDAPPVRRVAQDRLSHPDQRPGRHDVVPASVESIPGEGNPLVAVIDLPAALFAAVCPAVSDLALSAHVREVQIAGKADRTGGVPPRHYAVVTATATPRDAGGYVAHLVSIEGFSGMLADPPAAGVVRLVTLHAWRFTVAAGEDDFRSRMKAIDIGVAGVGTFTGEPAADRLLAAGFWPLAYLTADRNLQLAWYRSPLSGRAAGDEPDGGCDRVFATASEALLAFDPASGGYDATAAVAWMLGRLIALHHGDYAEAVYRLRHDLTRAGREVQEFDAVVRLLTGPAAEAGGGGLSFDAADGSGRAGMDADATAISRALGKLAEKRFDRRDRFEPGETLSGDEAIVAARLGRLVLLEDVPLGHLVPDISLLPSGSLRFFRIDPGWIAALVDGALSIGEEPGAEAGRTGRAHLARLARAGLEAGRADFVSSAGDVAAPPICPAAEDALPVMTGFLLRATLVTDWPGIEVEGYRADRSRAPLLRLSLHEPDCLIAIFDGIVEHVILVEPAESLYFLVPDNAAQAAGRGKGSVSLAALAASMGLKADAAAGLAKSLIRIGTRMGFKING